MKRHEIIVTIYEPTVERALEAIGSVSDPCDGFEIRVDRFDPDRSSRFDPNAFRAATERPLIYTRRSGEGRARASGEELQRSLGAGFDRADLELPNEGGVDLAGLPPGKVIFSFHDDSGTPPLEPLLQRMRSVGAGRIKIAVTPKGFDDNAAILELLDSHQDLPLTAFGMGAAGLYSRILAPFFGSQMSFVAKDDGSIAAPGQLTLHRALGIFGPSEPGRPETLFAVVGNPAAHSLSPAIHNAVFRKRSLPAAYSILQVESLAEAAGPFAAGAPHAPSGLSVTAPFKEHAYDLATSRGWELRPNALASGAANTLVRMGSGTIVVDNTDVDAFWTAFSRLEPGDSVAIVGAGGTARAALVAARAAGLRASVYNRTASRAERLANPFGCESFPLDRLSRFDGKAVAITVPLEVGLDLSDSTLRPGGLLIDVGYGFAPRPSVQRALEAGAQVFTGLQFLHAQAESQSRLFLESMGARV